MPLSALKEHAPGGEYAHRAPANLPQSTVGNLFTVTGIVRVTSIVGVVTTVIQTQATVTKITFTPTGGSAGDLCATLDITADVVGTLYTITGVVANALVDSAAAGFMLAQASALLLKDGIIKLSIPATSSSGQIEWWVNFAPVTFGATITAL